MTLFQRHTQYSFSIAPKQYHCLTSVKRKQVQRNQPSALGSDDGTGSSSLAGPRARGFPGVTEGGVGSASSTASSHPPAWKQRCSCASAAQGAVHATQPRSEPPFFHSFN